MNRYRVMSYAGATVEVLALSIVHAKELAGFGPRATVRRIGARIIRCVDCGTEYDDTNLASRGLPPLCNPCFTGRLIAGRV